MKNPTTIDGNEAAAYIAHKTNEVISIYPITPASPMGELADEWTARRYTNLWGTVPEVIEMQSEGGAAGAVHGSLQTGALTTTFTASQGLLLMIPNMYKIAGELTPTVFHIAARTVATHALSIFGDHSDVMAARATGFGMLFSGSVQEVMDLALIAQAATLKSRIPFLHVFDGFRTSHEVSKIEKITEDQIRAMIDESYIRAHRDRALSPDHPVLRGSAQNPDVFFQAREAVNPFYAAAPGIVAQVMDQFHAVTGRRYHPFDYFGCDDPERLLILMGSGAETAEETVNALLKRGEKVGLIKVRLYRPFSLGHFIRVLPPSVKAIAVLDRTKEPGAAGEPLYQDVVTAVNEALDNGVISFDERPRIVGGRYGLSSKEFTPAMVKAVFDELKSLKPKNHFTVGIHDDVSASSLDFDPTFTVENPGTFEAVFWGLGSDGTVSANKNSIKIIGEQTPNFAQGYFVYDSKKAGAVTISHLRFGPNPIKSTYLVQKADFVGVHQFNFIQKFRVLEKAKKGAVFLLNSPIPAEEIWSHLPRSLQKDIIEKNIRFYVIDAYAVASETGMGRRINTIMQTAFFAISGVLPREEAIERIKAMIKKTYGKKGDEVVEQNYRAVDSALDHLQEVSVPDTADSTFDLPGLVPDTAPEFVKRVVEPIAEGKGDAIPVSAFAPDGTFPVGTARWEKRDIALELPEWVPELCIQCGKCVMVCPHSCLRSKAFEKEKAAEAPESFKTMPAKWKELPEHLYSIQLSPRDCTGCTLCFEICPAHDKKDPSRKAIRMVAREEAFVEREDANWNFFLDLPDISVYEGPLRFTTVKDVGLLRPLFEFSGACAGCGETPYLKLMSQLFGDRAYVANATGCSSIYGGNLPTTPWTTNAQGRGPTWSNSLFEDNAEFGLGMRLAVDKQAGYARDLLQEHRNELPAALVDSLLEAPQTTAEEIAEQRNRVEDLKAALRKIDAAWAADLSRVADMLVKKSVWIVGGDGWAYDIGFGGLDHVLASGRDVNILVLDTEVYSNTGGQASKATPFGAVAKFAAGGKPTGKKNLAEMAMSYGNVYVATVALGASDVQTIRAFREAESYPGTSLIVAYAHCIAHGVDMSHGLNQQKLAVQSGWWPLFRFDPRLHDSGKSPLQLDYRQPKVPVAEFLRHEGRFRVLKKTNPELAGQLEEIAQRIAQERWEHLSSLSGAWH
ncbi:MAG: pyruvate:ferredoxin (flavodoxin) oxidoreductase [Candidatus Hydrogenedentota bacterium]|nr:MAG: pyruvate:ferredoxin (flavodoxin) oxidoreductase [Candidatus Hydrogenedentota bacterium]